MPRFIVKREAVPAAWAKIDEAGSKVSFGPRERATEFADAREAMRVFEAVCEAMWAKAQERDKQSQKRANEREAAKRARRGVEGFPWGAPAVKSAAPTWLQKKMGVLGSRWGGGTGKFEVEAKGLDSEAAGAFEMFYARSELGWLGGPKSKDSWGAMAWRSNLSEAAAFLAEEELEAALKRAPPAQQVSRLAAQAAFTRVALAKEPDGLSQAIASGVEARQIQADLEPKAKPAAKRGGGGRI